MRTFAAVPSRPYIGQLYEAATQVKNTKFGNQPALPPTTVPTLFQWVTYGAGTAKPNVAGEIIFPQHGARQLLDKILSVRIDNLGNPCPVYVLFTDTGYTVVCPPNTVVWEPCETNMQGPIYVVGEGFTDGTLLNTDGSPVATAVYFCNFSRAPIQITEFEQSAQLWKASASISRGGNIFNQNFGTPALGDQTIQYPVSVGGPGIIVNNVWGTPYPSGFLYLTHVDFTLTDLNNPGGAAGHLFFVLESTGTAGVLYNLNYGLVGNPVDTQKLLNFSAMQIKLDATQTYRIRVYDWANLTGILNSAFNFTTNPT